MISVLLRYFITLLGKIAKFRGIITERSALVTKENFFFNAEGVVERFVFIDLGAAKAICLRK